jgi:hypothetical protein
LELEAHHLGLLLPDEPPEDLTALLIEHDVTVIWPSGLTLEDSTGETSAGDNAPASVEI